MNNSTSTSMDMAMTPWLHFGNMDYLIFETWRPSSHGAIVGACIGLFLFCILDRCLAACRRTQESRWMARSIPISSNAHSGSSKEYGIEVSVEGPVPARRRLVPSFTPSQDIPRGVIHVIQSTFSYVLMLAVMTFNGAYIISVILGLGIGEVVFGRFGRQQEV